MLCRLEWAVTTVVVSLFLSLPASCNCASAVECSVDRVASAARLLYRSCSNEELESPSPLSTLQCSCGRTADGQYSYVACSEEWHIRCSLENPDVCGTHATLSLFDFDDISQASEAALLYEWSYDGQSRSETLRYWESDRDSGGCSFEVVRDEARGVVHSCSCRRKTCRDGSIQPSIDCSSYEAGAVFEGCRDDRGRPTGSVLEGLVLGLAGFSCQSRIDRSLGYYDDYPTPSYYNAPTPTYYSAPTPTYYSAPTPTYYSAPIPSYYSAPTPTYYFAPTPTYSYRSRSKNNAPAIAGSVIGVLLAGLVAGLYAWYRHRKAGGSSGGEGGEGDDGPSSCWTAENLETCASVFKNALSVIESASKFLCPSDEARSGGAAPANGPTETGDDTNADKPPKDEEVDETTASPSDGADWTSSHEGIAGAEAGPVQTREYLDGNGVRVVEEIYYEE